MILLVIFAVIAGVFALTVLIGAPYVPSRRDDLAKTFDELYPLTKDDVVVDIGSGDGKVLRAAAQRGARAIGYEINPFLVVLTRIISWRDTNVSVRLANFWRVQLPPETTLIYTFGESRDIEKMALWVEKQATRLGKKLYFVSYAFELKNRSPEKSVDANHLYLIEPLQP